MSLYSITENTKTGSALMQPGINENVKIVDIVRENSKQDGTGAEVLRFYFEDENGGTFNHTEFPIDEAHTRTLAKSWKQDPDQLVKKTSEDLASRIKHILSAFMPPESIIIKDATGWEDYCDKVVALAGKLYQGQLFRIKVILNKKDFNTFPKVPVSPFVQNMEEKNSMFLNPKYDRVVPNAATKEDQYDDGLDDAGDDAEFEDEF